MRRSADAAVEATCAPFPAQLGPLGKTRSRADGSFELDCIGRGPFRVTASQKGETGAVDEAEGGRRDLEIVLRRRELGPTATLRGVVLDARGEPVTAASVVARPVEESPGRHADADLTNSEGEFELRRAPVGAVRVVALRVGFGSSEPVELALAEGADVTLELRLREIGRARIEGVVLGGGGAPLAEVGVRAHTATPADEWLNPTTEDDRTATTDAAGRFGLDVLAGRVSLYLNVPEEAREAVERARGDGPRGICLEHAVSVAPGDSARVEIALGAAPILLHGSIEIGGRRPAGVVVSASSSGVGPLNAGRGEDGSYVFFLPGPGTYTLLVQADGAELQPVVDVPAVREHRFDVVVPLARAEGRVRDSAGRGLAAVTVDAMSHGAAPFQASGRAVTGADGEYVLEVPPGTYRVFPREDVERERSFAEVEERIVTLVEGPPVRGIDFELSTAGAVEGIVRLPGGAPAAGCGVELFEVATRVCRRELTDEDGRFRFASLQPGRVWLHARKGAPYSPECLVAQPLAVDVSADAGVIALDLVSTARLGVRLPAPSSHEVLDTCGRASAPGDSFDAEGGGALTLFALAPGTYLVRVRQGNRTLDRAVELPAAGLELDLRAAGASAGAR